MVRWKDWRSWCWGGGWVVSGSDVLANPVRSVGNGVGCGWSATSLSLPDAYVVSIANSLCLLRFFWHV